MMTSSGIEEVDEFTKRMWGDAYYNPGSRTFQGKPPQQGYPRTFVQFILEPLYKIYTQALGENELSVEVC